MSSHGPWRLSASTTARIEKIDPIVMVAVVPPLLSAFVGQTFLSVNVSRLETGDEVRRTQFAVCRHVGHAT
jgi:hypothetical protein